MCDLQQAGQRMNTAREASMFGVMFGVLPCFSVPRLLGFPLALNWNCLHEISILALSNVKLAAPFPFDKKGQDRYAWAMVK